MDSRIETTAEEWSGDGCLRTESEIQSAYSTVEVASSYVRRRFELPLMAALHAAQVRSANDAIKSLQPSEVLEIAPGPGRVTRHIKYAGRLTCLEFNSVMIEEGKRACREDIRWVQGNAFEMDFGQQFDCIYTFRFIRHFEERDRGRLYDRIAAALRPGGVFLMDAVNKLVSLPLRESRPEEYPVYDKLYEGVDEIRRELSEHRLILQSARPVLRWFRLQSWLQDVVGPRSDWLCRKSVGAVERIPSGSPLEWIVQCRRE